MTDIEKLKEELREKIEDIMRKAVGSSWAGYEADQILSLLDLTVLGDEEIEKTLMDLPYSKSKSPEYLEKREQKAIAQAQLAHILRGKE